MLGGGDAVAGNVEEVGDGVVDRDEALDLAGRLEPLPLAFPSSCWLMGVLTMPEVTVWPSPNGLPMAST
jgi:hypothetical protein